MSLPKPLVSVSWRYFRVLEEVNLLNYKLIIGKSYMWIFRCKKTRLCLSHFNRILLNDYHTGRYSSFKLNKMNLFKRNRRMFEGANLIKNWVRPREIVVARLGAVDKVLNFNPKISPKSVFTLRRVLFSLFSFFGLYLYNFAMDLSIYCSVITMTEIINAPFGSSVLSCNL